MKYFAYGSNMSLERLHKRVPEAKNIGLLEIRSYTLKFHKKGEDGSAKCDALYTGNDQDSVIGVVFEIPPKGKLILDDIEGPGYDVKTLEVKDDAGKLLDVFLYVANQIDNSLAPYTWYLHHVVHGALEAKLPNDYVARIKQTSSTKDTNLAREMKELSIYQ